MIRVGIIEDNTPLRNSLTSLFNHTHDMKCVLSLNNLLHVIAELEKYKPEIILLDIGLPNISGIEGVKMIKAHFPDILIMMFTVFEDDDKIFMGWCAKNNLHVAANNEIFFINSRILLKPKFIINNKIHVDLIEINEQRLHRHQRMGLQGMGE